MIAADTGDSARSWHGFPRRLTISELQSAVDTLDRAWRVQMGRPPGDINDDLEQLRKRWFDPLARGGRLRRELDHLEPLVGDADPVPDPFLIDAGEGRALITPEGRLLLDLLVEAASSDKATIRLAGPRLAAIDHRLASVYRSWSQRRLRDVIALRRGEASPLLPQAIGQVLFLLLNGAVSADRAIREPEKASDRRTLNEAVGRAIAAFADTLSPPSDGRVRSSDHYSLYGGYSVSEAARRLGSDLVVDPRGEGTYLAGSEHDVVSRIAEELRRRQQLTAGDIAHAFDAMVKEYTEVRPLLAALGVAYSTPSRTRTLRCSLLHEYGHGGQR